MVLLIPLTVSSFRGLVMWLRVLLRHSSGWLKACFRLVLALTRNASSCFRIIEGGNDGQRRALLSSCAPSYSIPEPVVPIYNPAINVPVLSNMPEPGVTTSPQVPATDNLAITGTYTSGFATSADSEVQDETGPPKLKPTLASRIQNDRYEGHLNHTLPETYSYSAPPGVPDFVEKIDDEWQPVIHPEGALFFYGTAERIITEADIRKKDVAKKIKQAIDVLRRFVRDKEVLIPETAELVLGINKDHTYGYYFVDHRTKSLFWAHDHKELFDDIFESTPATEKSHIKYAYENQYWMHCALFPNKRIIQTDVVDRLKGIIMFAYSETVTTEASLAPYNADDLSALITLIGLISDSVGKPHEHYMCMIARLMQTFTYSQFINFCGQPAARLDIDKPLYHQREPEPQWKEVLLYLFNIALFGSLQSHKMSIERVWVDKTVVVTRSKNFFDNLKAEWNGFSVFSTVMLAVDVSFLAVPGVESASQIITHLSTLCAMGSLISSLILASQIQGQHVDDAGEFLWGMSTSLLGLDGLAVLHSLPFALLIWAMIFFAIGLGTTMFHPTQVVAGGVEGAVFATIFLLTLWLLLAINNFHVSSLIKSLAQRGRQPDEETPGRVT